MWITRAIVILLLCALAAGCGGGAPEAATHADALTAPEDQPGITLEDARLVPPLAPANVRVETAGAAVTVIWTGTGATLSHYEISRKSGKDGAWKVIARVADAGENTNSYRWSDPAPVSGAVYGVAAVAPYGARSEIAVGK